MLFIYLNSDFVKLNISTNWFHFIWNQVVTQPAPPQQQQQQQQKHDIFVGNLAFSTTEEQLHQAFSELGNIIKVRMVNDLETGKPRGFAFIELT